MNQTEQPTSPNNEHHPTGSTSSSNNQNTPSSNTSSNNRRQLWLQQYPLVAFILPLLVFMLMGMLEPKPSDVGQDKSGFLSLDYQLYPAIYTLKIIATCFALWFVWPAILQFPFRINPLAIIVGLLGAVVWIAICNLRIEEQYLLPPLEPILSVIPGIGGDDPAEAVGQRSAYQPFEHLADSPAALWSYIAVRLFGLAVVIAIAEELFLRGFLMRFVTEHDWWTLEFGQVNPAAIILATAVPMLMHPSEFLAAAVWFSGITWLMLRTKNIWDCILAHAITNLVLGIYVFSVGGDAYRLI